MKKNLNDLDISNRIITFSMTKLYFIGESEMEKIYMRNMYTFTNTGKWR